MTSRALWLPALHGRDKAATFVDAWLLALGDRAALYRADSRLEATARAHAQFLAAREGDAVRTSMHVGAGGSAPNGRVRAAGYRLPLRWPDDANHVESCASNWQGPTYALDRLLLSPSHRAHLLGESSFANSTVFGVAVALDYYVVLACPEEAL